MGKVDFGKIDKLHDPQRIISATFDSNYVEFIMPEKSPDKPKIVAKAECLRGLLKWVDDESAIRTYGFDCKTDRLANVFNVSWADRWVVLHYTDEKKVVHHAFLSRATSLISTEEDSREEVQSGSTKQCSYLMLREICSRRDWFAQP